MKFNLKYVRLIFVASCFFYLSCQPSGGDFIPVLSDGAILKPMFSKKSSALQYNNEKFSIKVAGNEWGVMSYGGSFWIVLKNNDAKKVTVNFDKIQLKNSLEQKLEHSSAIQFKHRDEPEIPKQKIVSLTKGEMRAYNISFGDTNKTEQIEKREKYLGQTISLTILVETELEDKNYEFQFKYGDYLPQGEYNETLID
jgi:hypothetical protein